MLKWTSTSFWLKDLRTLKALIQERSTFLTHHGEIFLFGNLLERK